MNISPKVRFLNFFRNVFRISPIEKVLAQTTVGKSPDRFVSKLVPNPYQYPEGSFRIIERKGIRVKVDVSDYIGHYIYFGFEDPSIEKLLSLCKPGANVIDIGANIGWTMLNLSRRSLTGKIYGFEPDPYNYDRCRDNIELNKFDNVFLFPLGLSDVNAQLSMEVRVASNRGGNRISTSSNGSHKVNVIRLDDFEPVKSLSHVDLVKIDVEGYEMQVLKGSMEVLKQHHPVMFIELDDNNLKDQGYSAKDLIVFLNDNGYRNIVSADDDRSVTSSDDFRNRHFDIIARWG